MEILINEKVSDTIAILAIENSHLANPLLIFCLPIPRYKIKLIWFTKSMERGDSLGINLWRKTSSQTENHRMVMIMNGRGGGGLANIPPDGEKES